LWEEEEGIEVMGCEEEELLVGNICVEESSKSFKRETWY
jgi:hypothetical protein